ncbi:hypothetical protein OE88DRAFT_1651943 [Heliocybe sulcata]|uniref:Uncharacterized protein n=1 Tax=Heliocybe sulcata TaxID=5364 RepID=A0A5C3NPH0_9AGAM|nr:hypothetical protein OE88DRAFT_1651943 [Heliocybe sulcata]
MYERAAAYITSPRAHLRPLPRPTNMPASRTFSSGHRLEPIPESPGAEYQWTYTQTSHHRPKHAYAGPSTSPPISTVDARTRRVPQIVITRAQAQPPLYHHHYPRASRTYPAQNPAFLTTPNAPRKSTELYGDSESYSSSKTEKRTDTSKTSPKLLSPGAAAPAGKLCISSPCRQPRGYTVQVSVVPVDSDDEEDDT